MNTVQRIAKNTAVLLTADIISKVLGFFYVMYTARYLGAEGFGVLSFAFAFAGIFEVFTDLGIRPLTVREVARDKSLAGKYLGNIAVIKIFLVIITFGLIAITINLLDYPKQAIKVVYFISLSVIFTSFTEMFYSIFQAYEKMEYQSMGQILSNVLMLTGALFAISQRFSVVGFASIYILVSAIVLGYAFTVCVWKFVLPKIEVDWSFWKPTIKEALPFALVGIFVVINQRIDRIMLSKMVDMTSVGWYSAAYNLVLMIEFIPAAFISSIYPLTSRFYSSKEKLEFILRRGVRYMFALGLPIGVGTTLLADKIIFLIYGQEYAPSISALQIIVWSDVIIFVALLFNNLLVSTNKQILITKQVATVALLNIIMNLILIPKYSYIGASIATVMSSIIGFTILYYYISKEGYSLTNELIHPCIKILIACSVMIIFIYFFKELNFFILIFFSASVYLTSLYLMKAFDDVDVDLFRRIFSKAEVGK